jgi:hypothetical protein
MLCQHIHCNNQKKKRRKDAYVPLLEDGKHRRSKVVLSLVHSYTKELQQAIASHE